MGLFKKKPTVDTAEVLLVRSEIAELKERLEASEQAKVVLEDRLSSIAATTMILSNTAQSNTAEIVEQIESIHNRLDTADAVGSKVDELHQRVIEAESRHSVAAPDSETPSDLAAALAALSGRIEQVAQLAAAPAQPDDELAARLEELTSSAETVALLNQQFGTLSSRVNAQAEMADQLRALSERISLLQQRSVDTTDINERIEQLSMAGPMTDELGERLVDLSARVAASEQQAAEARAKATELETRLAQVGTDRRKTGDEMRVELSALSGRVTAHDQLTQQLTALESRLAASEDEVRVARQTAAAFEQRLSGDLTGDIEQRLGELASRVDAQAGVNEQLDELGRRIAETEAAGRAARDHASSLDERVGHVNDRVGELDQLRERLDHVATAQNELPDQLAALNRRVSELQDRGLDVDRIHERLDQLSTAVPSTDGLKDEINRLAERIANSEGDSRSARELAAALEDRLGNISTELANQLGELSTEMDQLASREPELVVAQTDEQAVLALKASQVKLATEQARYEITFREDLATLAEQVRQLRGRS